MFLEYDKKTNTFLAHTQHKQISRQSYCVIYSIYMQKKKKLVVSMELNLITINKMENIFPKLDKAETRNIFPCKNPITTGNIKKGLEQEGRK